MAADERKRNVRGPWDTAGGPGQHRRQDNGLRQHEQHGGGVHAVRLQPDEPEAESAQEAGEPAATDREHPVRAGHAGADADGHHQRDVHQPGLPEGLGRVHLAEAADDHQHRRLAGVRVRVPRDEREAHDDGQQQRELEAGGVSAADHEDHRRAPRVRDSPPPGQNRRPLRGQVRRETGSLGGRHIVHSDAAAAVSGGEVHGREQSLDSGHVHAEHRRAQQSPD